MVTGALAEVASLALASSWTVIEATAVAFLVMPIAKSSSGAVST